MLSGYINLRGGIFEDLLAFGITKYAIHTLAKPGVNLGQIIGPNYVKKSPTHVID